MLATLAEIKTYLGETTTDFDSFLTMQGQLLTESIEGYCGRLFQSATYTQKFYRDGKCQRLKDIYLYQFPVISITEITEDAGDPITDYLLEKDNALLTRSFPELWLQGTDVLEIEYVAGFAVVPSPVMYTFYSIIEANYNKKKNGIDINFGRDVQRISIPGALSIDFDYTLDANERKNRFGAILNGYLNVLDPYRSERVLTGQIGRKYE